MSLSSTFSKLSAVFKRRPFLTNVASYGVFYVSAEVAQQMLDRRFRGTDGAEALLDHDALSRYALVGTVGIGPTLYVWYRFLDKWMPSRAPRYVISKVITDQLVSSPVCLGIFFVGMSALEGKEDIFYELKKKFWSTYAVSCCFWPTIQAINFGLLPAHTRVAFVGAASFVWANILCLVKRQQLSGPSSEEKSSDQQQLSVPSSGVKSGNQQQLSVSSSEDKPDNDRQKGTGE